MWGFAPMLQISFWGIYRQGSRMKLIRNIGENIANYQKILERKNLDLKKSENIGQIDNLKNLEEIGIMGRN